jgi:hypothetical protein
MVTRGVILAMRHSVGSGGTRSMIRIGEVSNLSAGRRGPHYLTRFGTHIQEVV